MGNCIGNDQAVDSQSRQTSGVDYVSSVSLPLMLCLSEDRVPAASVRLELMLAAGRSVRPFLELVEQWQT